MNLLLKVLPADLPAFLRREILAELFTATADAFGCPAAPAFDHLSFNERLQSYARFTREQADRVLQSGEDIHTVKTHLYRNANPLGEKLRKAFGIKTQAEGLKLAQILYRAIGVEIQGDPQGYLRVNHCYFSRFYSAPVCDMISAFDAGIFSGLTGGRRLVFLQRLTEGDACCLAILQGKEG